MEIRLLGALEVDAGAGAINLGGHRQRAVLAFLAINANEVIPAERIADEVWDGEPPRAAPTTLQGYVFHLRKALGDGPAAIETRKPGYVLRVDDDVIDVRRAERLIARAHEERALDRHAAAAALLREALGLWRGEPLADFAYEAFAQTEIARITELRLTALESRIECDLALGLHDQLVAELDALVRDNPLRETLRGHLMLALHRSGRSADALRVYAQGRELLVEELGIDPGLALQRLERAILMQDEEVEAAPRPAPVATGSVPMAATSFVGRESELRDIAGFLGRRRLVTLTGAGGSGKTRLAMETALRSSASYGDGAWVVELAGWNDPTLVPNAIADALGLTPEPDRAVIDTVIEHVRPRTILLVVDNCEHLVAAAADAIDRLLRACPRLTVVATSREALGVEGELAWSVPTLAVPDPTAPATLDELLDHAAVELFVDRASTARPDFVADDANIATIVAVCSRLDGMPLAIELAAARMRVLTIEQISERLHDRFKLLTTTARTALSRHRTLRATVDWSYESLDAVEQILFDRLSVFAGIFTLERVEAVCAGEELNADDIVDVLTSLVNKSLVVPAPTGFRLLETLREYGAQRLEDRGVTAVIRARHARACCEAAREATAGLHGPDGRVWLDRLEAEHDDSRAALEWLLQSGNADGAAELVTALWPFWWHRGSVTEGRRWLTRVLAMEPSPAARLWVLVGAARLATMEHDLASSSAACDEGMALANELGNNIARGELLVDRAECLLGERDRIADADSLAQEAVETLRAEGATWSEANAMRLLTLIARVRGDARRAADHATACLERFAACGDVAGTAGANFLLAQLARERGDVVVSDELCQQSLVQFRQMRDAWGVVDATRMLGDLALARGDAEGAARLAAESMRLDEDLGHHRGMTSSLLLLSRTALAQDDTTRADALCDQAADLVEARRLSAYVLSVLVVRAQIRLAAGDAAGAEAISLAALDAAGGAQKITPLCLLGLARLRLGNAMAASEALQESLELAQSTGDHLRSARALEGLAELAANADEMERAARYLSAAHAARGRIASVLTGAERRDHDRVFTRVREAVVGTAFGQSWLDEWNEEVIDLRPGATRPSR